jgi:outer membrane protein OmpA-like peptidoglycan-associated protein
MKNKLLIFLFLGSFLSLTSYAQEVPVSTGPQTTVTKGLKELDRVATKTWEELKRIFKREKPLMTYKIGTNKHETVVKQHQAPPTYFPVRNLVTTSKDQFAAVAVEKDRVPQLEAKALFPRITATKGYVSFKVGDLGYQRYLNDIKKENIEKLTLRRPDSVECIVKKWVLLPKREVKRHYSFVLDHSGSMGDYRASELQESVFEAVQANSQRDPKALTTYSIQKFDGEGNIRHLITSSEVNRLKQVLVPPIGLAGFGRSTAIKDALYEAIQKLSQDSSSDSKIIILFTDGETNTDQISLDLSEVIRLAIDNNINVIPVGFGEYVNEEYLKTIAYYAGGEFYQIYHEDEFATLFDNMLQDIGLNYELEFSPCMFGEEVEIELSFKGLDTPLKATTFFSTPAREGYTIDLDILFKEASAEIDQAADLEELEQLLLLMQAKTDIRIVVEGHTDKVGTEKYNLDLSLRRANAVKEYLVKKGIDSSRIETKGYGWSTPAYPYQGTEKENPLNRRIEVKIAN